MVTVAAERTVFVVDDDDAARDSLVMLLKSDGLPSRGFASAHDFLATFDPEARGCIVSDLRMPGMDGIELIRELKTIGCILPVIVITGHADVSRAVDAMKAGASDFIEKPFEKAALISCIEAAHRQSIAARGASARAQEAQARLNVLTDRERDVLNGLVDGLPNKSIAYDLGISPRTVEIHRANLMQKLEVKSLAEALRIAFHAGEGMEATGG